MRKILYKIIILVCIIMPVNVFAEGYILVSPKNITLEEGSSKTITITAYNAVGDVSLKSNKPTIATISEHFWETGPISDHETKTTQITVKGIKKGKTTITINIDGATFDAEDLSGQIKKINVKVIKNKKSNNNANNKFIIFSLLFSIILILITIVRIIKKRKK